MAVEALTPQRLEPVTREARQLGAWGFAVLWGALGIGLLVLLAGSFLVPALSLPCNKEGKIMRNSQLKAVCGPRRRPGTRRADRTPGRGRDGEDSA